MKLFVFGLAACVAVGLSGLPPGARADEPNKQAKGEPAKEFAAIQKDWAEAQQAFMKAYQGAKTNEERTQVLREKRPQPKAYAERCLKLAESHPDSPVAVEALGWVIANGRNTAEVQKAMPLMKDKLAKITDLGQLQKILSKLPAYGFGDLASQIAEKARKNLDQPQAPALLMWVASATLYGGGNPQTAKLYNKTVDLLVEHFADRPELAPLPNMLRQDDDPPWAEKHLRRLIEKNPSERIKGQARFALAMVLKNKDEASQPEAEKLLQAAIDDLSKRQGGFAEQQQLAEAKKELQDMKLRGIGKPAPEINGEDLEGKQFKLSDYKGKVVLLDFWGNW